MTVTAQTSVDMRRANADSGQAEERLARSLAQLVGTLVNVAKASGKSKPAEVAAFLVETVCSRLQTQIALRSAPEPTNRPAR